MAEIPENTVAAAVPAAAEHGAERYSARLSATFATLPDFGF